MPIHSLVELKDLRVAADIGTYGPDDVVPDSHLLDLTLTIATELVLIAQDDMALVFDYDPLIHQIDSLGSGPTNFMEMAVKRQRNTRKKLKSGPLAPGQSF